MNFTEALQKLQCGAAVRRTTWPMKDGYLKLMMGFNTIWKVLTVPTANAGNYLFTLEDFNGNDWEEISHYSAEEPKVETIPAEAVVQ